MTAIYQTGTRFSAGSSLQYFPFMSHRQKHMSHLSTIATIIVLGIGGGGRLLAQKTPDRPPIDLNPPEEVPVAPARWSDALSGALIGEWGFPVGAFHQNEDGGGGAALHVGYAVEPAHMLSLRT